MKKIFLLFLLFIVFLSEKASAYTWLDLPFSYNGQQVTMNNFKGNVVIIMFWATWCPYCQKQMPQLSLLKNHYSNQKNVSVIAFSTDKEGDSVVKGYLDSNGFSNLDIVTDPSKNVFRSLGLVGVPTIVLVSKDGQIVGTYNKISEIDTKLVQTLAE